MDKPAVHNTQYITLDELVKQYLIDIGAPNNNMYNSFFTWATRGLEDLNWDVLKQFKYTFLPVDPATKMVKLPDDFLQYTRVGFVNQVNEIIDLAYDPNLAFQIEQKECHCDDCGCASGACFAITNAQLETEVITLPTNVKKCNYSVDFTALAFPYTINYVSESTGNRQIQVGIDSEPTLDIVMGLLGWTKNGNGLFEIDAQTILWFSFDLTVSGIDTTWYINETSCVVSVIDTQYTNTTKTCVSAQGDIYQEQCLWGFTNGKNACNYYFSFGIVSLVYPLTSVRYKVNGATVNAPDIASYAAFVAFMAGLGLRSLNNSATRPRFGINQTTDIWQQMSFVTNTQSVTDIIGATACNSGTTVTQNCADTTICKAEIKPCGCLVMTDQVINTLIGSSLVNNNMFERWVHGGDISTTYKQPWNLYGFYNIDAYQGIIQLDPFFKYNTIYLEYFTTSVVDTKEYLVPILARDYILSYIHKMSLLRKSNVPLGLIEMAKKQNRADKHNLKLRITPPRAQELKSIFDTPPSRS